jgi:excinuclease ABC subunit A
MIKNADWIIDLGPGAGNKGGHVIATGTPEEVMNAEGSYTGQYLRNVLNGAGEKVAVSSGEWSVVSGETVT